MRIPSFRHPAIAEAYDDFLEASRRAGHTLHPKVAAVLKAHDDALTAAENAGPLRIASCYRRQKETYRAAHEVFSDPEVAMTVGDGPLSGTERPSASTSGDRPTSAASEIRNTPRAGDGAESTPAITRTPDPIDQIRRLGELHDHGLLTTEEFNAKKIELLDLL